MNVQNVLMTSIYRSNYQSLVIFYIDYDALDKKVCGYKFTLLWKACVCVKLPHTSSFCVCASALS